METSSPPGLAVSGLMQQLKSGEITKMQLFQQLAKLQTGPGVVAGPPSVSTIDSGDLTSSILSNGRFRESSSGLVHGMLPSNVSTDFVTSSRAINISASAATSLTMKQDPVAPTHIFFGSALTPMPFTNLMKPDNASSLVMPSAPDFATLQSKPGVVIVESDAEVFACGVSHDMARQFSVQEWMANKSRIPATNQALPYSYQQQSHVKSDGNMAETHYQINCGEEVRGPSCTGAGASFSPAIHPPNGKINSLKPGKGDTYTFDKTSSTTRKLTSPDNALGQILLFDESSFFKRDDGKDEQQYLDFTKQFQEEHDSDCIIDSSSNDGGKGGNLTSTDGQFHARVTRWKSQKDANREQMKQQQLQSELNECTFTPKVNPKSTKVVAKLRGQQHLSVSNEGLTAVQLVSERLYQEADMYRVREHLATKVKADKEAEIDRQCTFKPKTNPGERVKAKYMVSKSTSSPLLTAASREAAAKELAECTFNPKVNGIRSDMVSAQLYLQQNIYMRLSKPWCSDANEDNSFAKGRNGKSRSLSLFGDDDNEIWLDLDSNLPQSCQDDISLRPGGRNRRRLLISGGNEQGPRSVDAKQSQESKEERARQFQTFIKRQKFHEQARHERIEQAKQQLTLGYKPIINKKSIAMMGNGRKGDFLQRVSTYARRKEYENGKKKSAQSSDPNCTFKPAINQASIKRKPRSITELSRGDLLRRETTQRLMKLKMEQEEMTSLTFRPLLNRTSDRYEGRLKILSSPETYLQRIKQQSQENLVKQRRAIQEKEVGEFNECTFKPHTIEAPAYVQRIARSVSLTKALRARHQATARAKEKPEWK